MRALLPLLLLSACDTDAPVEPVRPPVVSTLDLEIPPLVPGATVQVLADGLTPGETAWLAVSPIGAGANRGPCPAVLNGACLSLRRPTVLGTATADVQGIASFPVTVPLDAPLGTIPCFQVAEPRVGVEGVVSPPECAPVEACAPADREADFTDDGTYNTTAVEEAGVRVESSSGGLRVLDIWGMGVVGGANDSHVETGEWTEITFTDGPAGDVEYHITSAGNQNQCCGDGERIVEAFAPDGTSYGAFDATSLGWHTLNVAADMPVARIRITADGDIYRLGGVRYSQCP